VYLFFQRSEHPLGNRVILLIGTNDMLRGADLDNMIAHYTSLLKLLKLRSVTHLVVVTLPPVPKLSLMPAHWEVSRIPRSLIKS